MEREQPNANLNDGPHDGKMISLEEDVVRRGWFSAEDDELGGRYVQNADAPSQWEYEEPTPRDVRADAVQPGWIVSSSRTVRAEVLAVEPHFEDAEVTLRLRNLQTGEVGNYTCHVSDPFGWWNCPQMWESKGENGRD